MHECGKIEIAEQASLRVRLPFGQEEQVVRQPGEVAAFLEDVVDRPAVVVGGAIFGGGHLQGALHGRERAAEFMGGVRHELTLAVDVPGDLVEEAVDRGRQAVEFVARAMHRQAIAESRGPQMVGGLEDVGHGPSRPPGEPPAHDWREQDQGASHERQQPHERREAVVEPRRVGADPDVIFWLAGLGDPQAHVAIGADFGDVFLLPEVEGLQFRHFVRAEIALP